MFGTYAPDIYLAVITNSESYASLSRQWHNDADVVATQRPRLAARMRNVARALGDLSYLAKQIERERRL